MIHELHPKPISDDILKMLRIEIYNLPIVPSSDRAARYFQLNTYNIVMKIVEKYWSEVDPSIPIDYGDAFLGLKLCQKMKTFFLALREVPEDKPTEELLNVIPDDEVYEIEDQLMESLRNYYVSRCERELIAIAPPGIALPGYQLQAMKALAEYSETAFGCLHSKLVTNHDFPLDEMAAGNHDDALPTGTAHIARIVVEILDS